MFNLLPRKAFYLPFLLLLLLAHHQITAVGAYDPDTGSAVAGNLTASAPWGIPPDKFASATKSPDASAAFSTLGYNVSDTAPSPASVDGWTLAVGVAYDVSLSDAADAPAGADGDDAVFQATTLYLGPPAGMAMNDAWRICAAVFPGVAETAATAANAGGSCHEVLSSDCLLALGVATGGMNETGACNDIVLPERCSGDFPAGTGNISTVAINQTVLDDKRFYAYGSAASTSSGNTTAHDEARKTIWPLALIYGHLSSGGELYSSNVAVQCVRAENGTVADNLTDSGSSSSSSSAAAAMGRPGTWGSLVALAAIVGWALLE